MMAMIECQIEMGIDLKANKKTAGVKKKARDRAQIFKSFEKNYKSYVCRIKAAQNHGRGSPHNHSLSFVTGSSKIFAKTFTGYCSREK